MSGATPQQIWTTALRSDEYEQATGQLCAVFTDGTKKFCCLGVACEAVGMTYVTAGAERGYDRQVSVLPYSVAAWLLGLAESQIGDAARDPLVDMPSEYVDRDDARYYLRCTALNDEHHLTFHQIADMVDYFGIVADYYGDV